MGFSSKTGISLTSGFKYQAQSPLDLRRAVDTITERDELVTINAAWEGMHVYVKADKKTYEYRGGTTWIPVLVGSMYTHPTYTAREAGLYKITVDDTGHISGATAVTKADITGLGIPGQDTVVTYGEATTTANGLMTAVDKTKLDGIASGANKYVHPTYPEKGLGLYKVQVDVNGHIKSAVAIGKDDITALGIPGQDTNTTYTVGTESYSGTTKLYTNIGSAIDGTLTQKAIDDNYTEKSAKVNATLLASGWSGTTSPYTNTITISGVTTTNNVEVLIPSTITAAQAESWMAAGILCGSQDTDSITLKAYGDKPSIDIPIECIIRKDI